MTSPNDVRLKYQLEEILLGSIVPDYYEEAIGAILSLFHQEHEELLNRVEKEVIRRDYPINCVEYPDGFSTHCNNCIYCEKRSNYDWWDGYAFKHGEELATLTQLREKGKR